MSDEPNALTPKEQQLIATGQLFHTLAADPRYRRKVLGLIKEAEPGTVIPELDVEANMEARVAERVKPFEEENKKLVGRVEELERRSGREGLRDQYGLSEDELVQVEKLATESGITKADTAVDYWRGLRALGTPRATRVDAGLSAEDRKLLTTNPKAFATRQAERVIRELRGGRR